MKKISRICFITLVFMSATPPPSGAATVCLLPCGPGLYLDPVECECNECPENYYCPGGTSKIACPNDGTSPSHSDSEDDCKPNCNKYAYDTNEEGCKGTGYCGYAQDVNKHCIACISVGPDVEACNKYAGCYYDRYENECTPCPRGYYCESSKNTFLEEPVACEEGQTSQRASYSKADCYFDCELYNDYKDDLGVVYVKGMCKAAPGCYWNDDDEDEEEHRCEYCPEGYYCDNTSGNGEYKQKCPFNSTSDLKSTKKSDCYLGLSNRICDGNNVCYNLASNEKIYYWQTYDEYWNSVRVTKPAEFPKKDVCLQDDPLPCK